MYKNNIILQNLGKKQKSGTNGLTTQDMSMPNSWSAQMR